MSVYDQEIDAAIVRWAKGKAFNHSSIIKDVNSNMSDIIPAVMHRWQFSHPVKPEEISVSPNDTVGQLRDNIQWIFHNHCYDYEW